GGTAGGGAAGTSGGAAGGGAAPAAGCGPASTLAPADLHAAAAKTLLAPAMMSADMPNRCAFSSCHNTNRKVAMLDLGSADGDLKALLVDRAACEAPNLKVVASGGGDDALNKSWLWIKLTGAIDASNDLTVPATAATDWGTPGSCGQMGASQYGARMPWGSANTLPEAQLATVRDWICAGAPGK
ncbi:MAG: hypothetical protein ABW321_33885, partial [Polyangiales bacterium]